MEGFGSGPCERRGREVSEGKEGEEWRDKRGGQRNRQGRRGFEDWYHMYCTRGLLDVIRV